MKNRQTTKAFLKARIKEKARSEAKSKPPVLLPSPLVFASKVAAERAVRTIDKLISASEPGPNGWHLLDINGLCICDKSCESRRLAVIPSTVTLFSNMYYSVKRQLFHLEFQGERVVAASNAPRCKYCLGQRIARSDAATILVVACPTCSH